MVGGIGIGAIAKAGGRGTASSGTKVFEIRVRGKGSYLEAEKQSRQKNHKEPHDEDVGSKLIVGEDKRGKKSEE